MPAVAPFPPPGAAFCSFEKKRMFFSFITQSSLWLSFLHHLSGRMDWPVVYSPQAQETAISTRDLSREERGEGVMIQRILLAFDHTEASGPALEAAVELASLFGASLWVLVIEKHLPRYPATIGEVEEARELADQSAHALLTRAYLRALQEGIPFHSETSVGSAARTILDFAQTGQFDLLVLGTRSFLTAQRIIHLAPCSVLLPKEPAPPSLPG